MNVEHRLQHAARELRGVPVEVPPLGRPMRRSPVRVLQALAAPLLFVAGGLVAYGALQSGERQPMPDDVPSTRVSSPAAPSAPSAAAELQQITVIVDRAQMTERGPTPEDTTEGTSGRPTPM